MTVSVLSKDFSELDFAAQIHGFRMSLFEEHLGGLHESFEDPGTKECMQEVRRRAQHSWKVYTADEVKTLPCHLMPYPFLVRRPLTFQHAEHLLQ